MTEAAAQRNKTQKYLILGKTETDVFDLPIIASQRDEVGRLFVSPFNPAPE
jgi:hypothetical protein